MSTEEIVATNPEVHIKNGDRVVFGFVFGILTFWLFANGMLTLKPSIEADLKFDPALLNLAISLAALFAGCFGVIAGGLADKFGRLKLTYIGFGLSIVGSLLLIISPSIIIFSMGRVVQGISIACIMPSTMALIKEYFDGAARQRALSFWVMGSWGGSGLSSFVAGSIAAGLGWRAVYIASILVAIAGLVMIKGAPERKSTNTSQPMDKIGLISFMIALFTLNFLINKVIAWGVFSAPTIILAIIVIVGFIVFVKTEQKLKENAFIDFALLKNKSYLAACLTNFTLNMVVGVLLIINTYVQNGRGFSPFQTGLLTLSYTCTVLAMIRVGEKMLQTMGARKPMMWGPSITAFGVFLMAMTFIESDAIYVPLVFIGYGFLGLGLGMYGTPSTDTAVTNCPPDRAGMASGFYKMTSSLGGAFGISIIQAVNMAFTKSLGIHGAASAALFVSVGICLFTSFISFSMLPKHKPQ